MRRIAMISVHSCPLAALGGKETGGMNVYIRELSKALSERGCSIDIFTRSQNRFIPQTITFQDGIRIIHLKAGPEAPYDKSQIWFHLPEFLDNMEQFMAKEKTAYQLIHSHYWLSGWVGSQLRKRWGLPLLHMFHTVGYFKNRATHYLGEQEPEVRLHIEQQLMRQSDHITVSSQREKVQMVLTYGPPPDKISVVPCGVDTELFRPLNPFESKKQLNVPNKRFLLFVGRIDPVKGIDTLLRAMGMVKQEIGHDSGAHLLIIGGDTDSPDYAEGSEMGRLRQLTSQLGLKDMVTFLGSQRQDLLPYYYSAAEVCILPSRYESFGMVALEAMACGTPVIASKVGGLTALIQNDSCGFVVPEENEHALAEKICLLLANPSLKGILGLKARERALQYSWHTIADQILSLYHTVIENSCKRAQPLPQSPSSIPAETATPVRIYGAV